jgi:PHD/YefM family antitoxin component YafN of YafNO toxin-antitoxin module
MITLNPQRIKINHSKKKEFVLLPQDEYDRLIEELENLKDIKLYDEAKKEDNGERVSFSDYLKKRKVKK